MKKRFIFFAALAVFLAIAVTPADAGGLDIVKGPYLQQVTPTSIVIMWETNTRAASQVDYSPDGSTWYQRIDPTKVKIHEVQLTGLAVDTAYYYTVTSVDRSKTVTSAQSTFATAPATATPRDFRFVAYGDTRTNPTEHAAVVAAIRNSAPEIVIHTGDLVESGDSAGQWGPQFFDPAHDLMINKPLLPIIGNHEGSGNLFRDFFSLGNNDYWFAFTYGGVRFIGLNTYNASYSSGSTQYNWLVNELQSPECTSADWQIVYFHHPPYSSGSHGGDTGVQDYLVPLFEAYGVDMVFSGHDHFYESSFKDGVHYVVTGGGGAPLRAINVNPNPYQIYAESTLHHCVIDVTGESLTLSARYNGGVEFDGVTLYNVDVTPPTASLLLPLDNGPDDLDGDDGEVMVNTTQSSFKIQLSDVGDGIEDATVIPAAVTLTKEGGVDYTFGYDAGLDVITLAPTGSDFGNGSYVITLSGIVDLAGNPMAATTLTILIDTSIVPPVTLSFQQGVGGYSAMVDTMIRWATPAQNYDDSATEHYGGYQYQYNADTDSSGGPCQILLRFDGIIGPDPGQIPSGSTIVSATLRIRSTDDGNGGKLHRMLVSWVDTFVTWNNSFGTDGIQADDSEAVSVEDDGVPSNSPGTDVDLDVTATLQDLANEGDNYGWAILPNGTNGWHMAAAEHPTLDYRPELIVEFITTGNQPPTVSITSPSDGAAFTEGDSITIDAVASDSDGTVTMVEFYQGGSKLGEATTSPYSYTWNNVPVGSYSLTAKATDNEDATRTSAAVNITVNPPPDTVPPTPDPMTWAAVPDATGSASISMTATTATDDSGVEYLFECLTVGGHDSGWQNSPSYEDTGLTPDTAYTYTVKARDKSANQNETAESVAASATTLELSVPGQASEPTPPNEQIRVNRNTVILSWLAGIDATSHDVYLGTDEAAVISAVKDSAEFKGNQTQTTYDPPAALLKKTTYYWRIDEFNTAGTTTGDVWSFTTN